MKLCEVVNENVLSTIGHTTIHMLYHSLTFCTLYCIPFVHLINYWHFDDFHKLIFYVEMVTNISSIWRVHLNSNFILGRKLTIYLNEFLDNIFLIWKFLVWIIIYLFISTIFFTVILVSNLDCFSFTLFSQKLVFRFSFLLSFWFNVFVGFTEFCYVKFSFVECSSCDVHKGFILTVYSNEQYSGLHQVRYSTEGFFFVFSSV